MAMEVKSLIVGSKKATAAVIGGVAGGVGGFVVFYICMKYLGGLPGMDIAMAMKIGLAFGAMLGGGVGGLYPVMEGIREAAGHGK